MKSNERTLIVGIGSDFGDDQLGIVVARQLAEHLPAYRVLTLRSPLDLLELLDGIERLHLIDACRGAGAIGTTVRYDWPAPELAMVRFQGTHDFPLIAALRLAERLRCLPGHVTIWSIEVGDTDARHALLSPLSPVLAAAAERLAARLTAEVIASTTTLQDSSYHA